MPEKTTTKRSIYWNFEIYKESAPANYLEILKSFQISFALSPWHDKDKWSLLDEEKNPEHKAGTAKKAHQHGIFKFDSLKSYAQVKELTDKLNAPRPEVTKSISKSVQYFIHKNDPEKYQYEKSDIYDYCFGIEDYFVTPPTKAEEKQYLREMVAWCDSENVVRMNDLINEALKNHEDTWAKIFESRPLWTIERFVNGKWQEKEEKKKTGTRVTRSLAEQIEHLASDVLEDETESS